MKRFLIGFLWFVSIFAGSLTTVGFLSGLLADLEGLSEQEAHNKGYELGEQLGVPILLLSTGAAIVGTATQKLPGTKA